MEGAGEEDGVVLGGDGNSLGNTLGRESIAIEENKDGDDDDSGDEGNSKSRGDCNSFGVAAGELGSGSRQASSSCRCWSSCLWFAAVASAEVRRGGALTDDVAAVASVAELSSSSWGWPSCVLKPCPLSWLSPTKLEFDQALAWPAWAC